MITELFILWGASQHFPKNKHTKKSNKKNHQSKSPHTAESFYKKLFIEQRKKYIDSVKDRTRLVKMIKKQK